MVVLGTFCCFEGGACLKQENIPCKMLICINISLCLKTIYTAVLLMLMMKKHMREKLFQVNHKFTS